MRMIVTMMMMWMSLQSIELMANDWSRCVSQIASLIILSTTLLLRQYTTWVVTDWVRNIYISANILSIELILPILWIIDRMSECIKHWSMNKKKYIVRCICFFQIGTYRYVFVTGRFLLLLLFLQSNRLQDIEIWNLSIVNIAILNYNVCI